VVSGQGFRNKPPYKKEGIASAKEFSEQVNKE
jgi:hypothetical protein